MADFSHKLGKNFLYPSRTLGYIFLYIVGECYEIHVYNYAFSTKEGLIHLFTPVLA